MARRITQLTPLNPTAILHPATDFDSEFDAAAFDADAHRQASALSAYEQAKALDFADGDLGDWLDTETEIIADDNE